MPHFIVECSEGAIPNSVSPVLLSQIHKLAQSSGLFREQDIKTRIKRSVEYTVSGETTDFIHVFSYIMEGRTTEQKAALSKSMVSFLAEQFPEVPFVAMNIIDFERATYVNKSML